MSKRYGNCQKKHAEVTIKSVIRRWATEEVQIVEGVPNSKKQIEEIVAEQFEAIDNRGACNWIGCNNE